MTRTHGKHTGNNGDITSWTLTSYEGKGGGANRKGAFNFRKFFGEHRTVFPGYIFWVIS